MNDGPFTFQCACLHCNWRSMHSARRWLSSGITSARIDSGRSFLVENIRAGSRVRFVGIVGFSVMRAAGARVPPPFFERRPSLRVVVVRAMSNLLGNLWKRGYKRANPECNDDLHDTDHKREPGDQD